LSLVFAVLAYNLNLRRDRREREKDRRQQQEDARQRATYRYFEGRYAFSPGGPDESERPVLNELDAAKGKADEAIRRIHQLGERVPVERLRAINDYTFRVFRDIRFVQGKWFQENARFFQGKPTMPHPPGGEADARVEFAFGPTDQVDDWRAVGYADQFAPVQLWCDVYGGPLGQGYIVTARLTLAGKVWHNQMQVGPEARGVINYLWKPAPPLESRG
jgi:hypothetical protein